MILIGKTLINPSQIESAELDPAETTLHMRSGETIYFWGKEAGIIIEYLSKNAFNLTKGK